MAIRDYTKADFNLKSVAIFEHNGLDVVIRGGQAEGFDRAAATAVGYYLPNPTLPKFSYSTQFQCWVELKPEIGDDFPAVMRQCKRLHANVVVVGNYNGQGATEAQMREMFRASDIRVVFVHEIEAEMAKGAA